MEKIDSQQNDVLPSLAIIFEFRENILSWYKINGRSFPWRAPSTSQYKLILSELLLQRTRAVTVNNFFEQFIHDYPSWKKISHASKEELEYYLKPLGLWKRRSSSLQALAQIMVNRNGRFPKTRKEIEKLPGVGQYITNAVLLFCHNEPQPLLDVNMARVLERVFGPRKKADIRYDPYLQQLAYIIVNCDMAKKVNWAIIDFAAEICLSRNPKCNECFLIELCHFKNNNYFEK